MALASNSSLAPSGSSTSYTLVPRSGLSLEMTMGLSRLKVAMNSLSPRSILICSETYLSYSSGVTESGSGGSFGIGPSSLYFFAELDQYQIMGK